MQRMNIKEHKILYVPKNGEYLVRKLKLQKQTRTINLRQLQKEKENRCSTLFVTLRI